MEVYKGFSVYLVWIIFQTLQRDKNYKDTLLKLIIIQYFAFEALLGYQIFLSGGNVLKYARGYIADEEALYE